MSKYLLEIGVEELPYKFIPSAVNQLKVAFDKFLKSVNVNFDKINVYATPRRLAVIIDGIADFQPDIEKIVKGPIKHVAYEENGNLSKAGLGFANKNGVSEKDLYLEDNYLYAKIQIKGRPTTEMLSEEIPSLILKLQGSHFMRWGAHDEKFSRPIKWIVSILNDKEVKLTIVDKTSSNITRGHRFANQNVIINTPDEYIEKLRAAKVIVDQEERKNLIVKLAKEEAAKIGATPRYDDDLLEEVTYLCEWPKAVTCNFDEKYLQIPEEVAVTVMASHQRYFALYKDNKLTNKFITITNFVGDDFENIKAGNLRVIKARLDDAVFFFNEDTKKSFEHYIEALKGVTFQKGMGSVYDKTQRIIELSKDIANKLGEDSKTIVRTAELCKADLTTSLVFEFTELQGFIGSDYAKVFKEDEKVSRGIKEHYFPLNAESELAESIEGQVVGIADKLDTIAAVFVDGKKPTGSSDPLGVRRAALGIIKTIINKQLKLDLDELIKKTLSLLPIKKDCKDEIIEFFEQRLLIYLADSYKKNILEACSISPMKDLCDYVKRVEALSKLEDETIIECAKRVGRLIKEDSTNKVNENLLQLNEEKDLFKAVSTLKFNGNYVDYLQSLIAINSVVENFFEKVLVMDKDENIKNNRIALLTMLKNNYKQIADFNRL